MDERIRNLLRERGTNTCCSRWMIRTWKQSFVAVMERLVWDADAIRDGIGRSVVRNLKTMAAMGVFLERAVHQRYPDSRCGRGVHSWEEYLHRSRKNLSGWSNLRGCSGCCSRRLGFPIRMNFLENIFSRLNQAAGRVLWLKRTRVVHRGHSL